MKRDAVFYKLADHQLNNWHIFMQWVVVRILWAQIHWLYRMRVKGLENKPKGFQSYVVASNHSSTLDPPILSVSLDYQPIAFMAKIELYKHPASALFYKCMAGIAVNREKVDISTIKSCVKVLKSGRWALGIFPEGTRTESGKIGEAKKGVAFIAKAGNAPVLPVGIHRQGPKNKDIYVRIGPMIPPEDDLTAFNQKITDAINTLIEQAQADGAEQSRLS